MVAYLSAQIGANILLAHFHYCNKGAHPFSDECRDLDLQLRAELNDDELQFVRATRSYANRHSKWISPKARETGSCALMYVLQYAEREWETLRDQGSFENDYFFVSQLFEDCWQPRSV